MLHGVKSLPCSIVLWDHVPLLFGAIVDSRVSTDGESPDYLPSSSLFPLSCIALCRCSEIVWQPLSDQCAPGGWELASKPTISTSQKHGDHFSLVGEVMRGKTGNPPATSKKSPYITTQRD